MLTHLRIQGLAIIESLVIDFSSRFNVITGETGAGKSILIKALSLLFGAKAASDVVRSGCEQAEVSGSYEIPLQHGAVAVLERLGVPFDVDGDNAAIIVRRQITAKGKSHAWINDIPVTLSSLKELGYVLIDIFGQFENQKLLNPLEHLYYLDEFISKQAVRTDFQEAYTKCIATYEEIESKLSNLASKLKDQDYIRFRCETLTTFSPSVEDYQKVRELGDRVHGALVRTERLHKAQAYLDQGADGAPISQAVWEATHLLADLGKNDKEMAAMAEEMRSVASRLDDLSYELGRLASNEEIDESMLDEAQSRLAGYQDYFRKFGVSDVENLIQEKERLERDLAFIENFNLEIRQDLKKLRELARDVAAKALELTKERKKAAESVKKKMESELQDLHMKGARFAVEFQSAQHTLSELDLSQLGTEERALYEDALATMASCNRSGSEKAQFLFTANQGEPPRPLHKIASGGEMSRIMLALKKALAAGAETCVLVFDEIDTGISGRAADVVGRKMKELSKQFQVICISHLAQVAAYADRHFLVEKGAKNKRTESQIVKLSEDQSAKEIARLLSGDEITAPSLAHAKELITKARHF